MKRALTAAIAVAFLALPAAATTSKPATSKPAKSQPAKPAPKAPCYSKAEFEAEQAIRLHTELMVVGLTCQQMAAPGENLFARYKEFTLKHQKRIQGWEASLIAFQKRTVKGGNATRAFDSFRTRVANEMSRRIAAVTAPVFCASHIPFASAALAMTEADLDRAVSGEGVVRVAEAPRCDLPMPGNPVVAERQAPATPAQSAPVVPVAASTR
ncbi:MAG TPA: hypothetical protein VEB20_12770 [Azospirillaceae bacterium]|nr:hypothetical protein [Azospirillaceae bacterium]